MNEKIVKVWLSSQQIYRYPEASSIRILRQTLVGSSLNVPRPLVITLSFHFHNSVACEELEGEKEDLDVNIFAVYALPMGASIYLLVGPTTPKPKAAAKKIHKEV
jgi:hypothetical protein